jgi:glycerate 2-kinase
VPVTYAPLADKDGSDGDAGKPNDPANAVIMPDTNARAANKSLDPSVFLAKNNSTVLFEMLDDLIVYGPTSTNNNDLRIILSSRNEGSFRFCNH